MSSTRNPTRPVRIGSVTIGGGQPIVVQSMCATRTSDIEATVAQATALEAAGAGVVRVAVDTRRDVEALAQIRGRTSANLSVDLQENYRLAVDVAPWVDKIRYNPGHLHHYMPQQPWQDKVQWLSDVAATNDLALRIGVNCGSVDPQLRERFPADDSIGPMLASALEHCECLDRLGFVRYCVSLKDSDPHKVVEVNRRFAAQRPDVPLHLGVTEAGIPPAGIAKTRFALVQLLSEGIGDTLRVSLTVPNARKHEEIEAGRQLLNDVAAGGTALASSLAASLSGGRGGLDIVSCPSCSRVQNEAFVELAQKVLEMTAYAANEPIKIAVMGCRVNGPGEADDADLGLWCGADRVNLKRGGHSLGAFTYDEILPRLKTELDRLIAERRGK